jgi:type IV pilus assembly protein PilQ
MRRPWAVLCGALLLALGAAARAGGSISLDVRDLDIYDTVRLLSTQSSVNVVVDSSVQHHPVTLRLRNVTFDEAIATIARANDLQAVRVEGVIYLGTNDAMNRRYPAGGNRTATIRVKNGAADDVARSVVDALPKDTVVVADKRTASIVVSGPSAVVERARTLIAALDRRSASRSTAIAMRYVKASEALKAIQATLQIAPPSSAFASDQQNQVVLTGTDDFIAQVRALVARVDRPGRQVRYDVRVTDIVPTENSNIGVLFGGADINGQQQAASGSTVTTFLRNSLLINATINALVSKGDARILARPSISSLNNVQASLLVGQQYPIVYFDARTGTQQVQFVNVGVNLTVTPTIGTDGAITTDLETDYSQVTGLVQSFPVITTRKAQSTLRVHDGETIVIAGLFSDVDSRTLTKVPYLADIPLIGEIFKDRQRNHNRDEVVFFITPHLVTDGDPANALPPADLQPNR